MSDNYKNNHYVPQWYQKKFMLLNEHELYYLDLKPEIVKDSKGIFHTKNDLYRQGARKCFTEEDLYTTKLPGIGAKDIEKVFFGKIDTRGRPAVEYFENFAYPLKDWGTSFEDITMYMSTQKLRTPKGFAWLSNQIKVKDKDEILRAMLKFRQLFCAIWTECVWLIADATKSDTKFIISDHPVTVYNRECGPRSQWCRDSNDPHIWLQGTHTLFPLSMEKILILTNLSWVRDPYQSAIKYRPNPNPFRDAIFKFTDIQTYRSLSEQEIREINFIIKSRASRYVAAAKKEWLYPEKFVTKSNWNTYGHGYLLMPDPRSLHGGGTIVWGNNDGTGGAIDEYGRRPWNPEFEKESKEGDGYNKMYQFKGDFAKLFGPRRRGRCMQALSVENEKDDEEFHNYHLSLRKKRYKDRKKLN